jgi:hypothetical protein
MAESSAIALEGPVGAIVDLWSILGRLSEVAPALSEAATVAAAQMTAPDAERELVREKT